MGDEKLRRYPCCREFAGWELCYGVFISYQAHRNLPDRHVVIVGWKLDDCGRISIRRNGGEVDNNAEKVNKTHKYTQ